MNAGRGGRGGRWAFATVNAVRTDVVGIEIKPAAGALRVGASAQLNLFARNAAGRTTLVMSSLATWAGSNDKVAEVNRQGRVTGRAAGTMTVRAQHAGHTAEAVFTITAA